MNKRIAVYAFAAMLGTGIALWAAEEAGSAQETTLKGEVVDMACYMDHGASGEKHAECAKTCIKNGLPVGLKTPEGKIYLLIGAHKPINLEIAPYAAKTISVKGKVVTRDGISMLENAEILTKS